MDSLGIAMIMSQRAADHEALSARPNAPVVPYVDSVAVARTRRTVADALRHLADMLAPAQPAGHHGC